LLFPDLKIVDPVMFMKEIEAGEVDELMT